jgi:hypothetical protein
MFWPRWCTPKMAVEPSVNSSHRGRQRLVSWFVYFCTSDILFQDRKHIIKVIKPHVERMCTDDEAQLVLFTALDIIEYDFRSISVRISLKQFISDTKLTAKSLVSDITPHISSLATSPQGRRSLFHLIVPRSRRHFTPAQIAVIAETDGIRTKTSKKDSAVRESEIRKVASEGLLQFVAENGAETARDTGGSLLILEIMLYADGGQVPFLTFLDHLRGILTLLPYRQVIRDESPRRGARIPLPVGRSCTTASDRSPSYISHVQKSAPGRAFFSLGTLCCTFACVLIVGICIGVSLNRREGYDGRDRSGRWCIRRRRALGAGT